jgi:hypothetical protein
MKAKATVKSKTTAKSMQPAKADRREASAPKRSKRAAPVEPIAPPIVLATPDRSSQVQAALYEIASAASAVQEMPEFYAAMHRIVGQLMYAKNCFVALYDEATHLISWPYYVDAAILRRRRRH